jgi:hypothetical protein
MSYSGSARRLEDGCQNPSPSMSKATRSDFEQRPCGAARLSFSPDTRGFNLRMMPCHSAWTTGQQFQLTGKEARPKTSEPSLAVAAWQSSWPLWHAIFWKLWRVLVCDGDGLSAACIAHYSSGAIRHPRVSLRNPSVENPLVPHSWLPTRDRQASISLGSTCRSSVGVALQGLSLRLSYPSHHARTV